MVTLRRTIRDSQGNAVQATAELTIPTPPPATPKLGASFKGTENLPAPVTSLATHRFFFQPGDFLSSKTWSGQPALVKAYGQYGCRCFSISVKPDSGSNPSSTLSSASQARLAAFLDTAPPDAELLLTFFHEHDGDLRDGSLTQAAYDIGSKQVADIAHAKGHKYGPIHNGMVYDPARTPKWGLWPNIWAQNEALLELYDFWGADCYSDGYENPSPRMDPLRTYADSLGLPLLIGELASPIDNAAAQATWAGKARTWALANTRWAHWWSSQVNATVSDPNPTNYRLTDASARAWFGLP